MESPSYTPSANRLCRNRRKEPDVMLSKAKHLAFSSGYKSRFFGGVYPERVEGPQNDIATQSRSGASHRPKPNAPDVFQRDGLSEV